MKRRIRKSASAIIFLMLLLISLVTPVLGADIPKPTNNFYVNDFAGILSQDTIDYIMDTNIDLNDKTGAQIVVVTMDTLDGDDLETFATDLFRSYGIGDAGEDNGVLLLLVKEDRDIRIEVGYGLEGAINDAKAGRILDTYAIPYLKYDKWDEGVLNTFKAIEEQVKTEYADIYDQELNDSEIRELRAPKEFEGPGFFEDWQNIWFVTMIMSVIIGVLSYKIFESGGKIVCIIWFIAATVYMTMKFSIWIGLLELFITATASLIGYVAVTPDDGESSSYSSGSSSRSSSSSSRSSSSGSSRSYSGGGGRSGGGGASRKF